MRNVKQDLIQAVFAAALLAGVSALYLFSWEADNLPVISTYCDDPTAASPLPGTVVKTTDGKTVTVPDRYQWVPVRTK